MNKATQPPEQVMTLTGFTSPVKII